MAQLTSVLASDGFAEYYTKAHSKNLGHAYGVVCQTLLEAGIDFVPNSAGLFVLLDLRKHLPTPDRCGTHGLGFGVSVLALCPPRPSGGWGGCAVAEHTVLV